MAFPGPDFAILEIIDRRQGIPALDRPEVQGEMVFTHIDRECVPACALTARATAW